MECVYNLSGKCLGQIGSVLYLAVHTHLCIYRQITLCLSFASPVIIVEPDVVRVTPTPTPTPAGKSVFSPCKNGPASFPELMHY